MHDLDAAEDWLDAWVADADLQAARTAELARRVSGLTGVARSADRLITVSVGSNGQLIDLGLEDGMQDLSGRELSRRILQVTQAAQRDLAKSVAAEVQRTVGAESETGRAVVDAFARRFPEPPQSEPDANENGLR